MSEFQTEIEKENSEIERGFSEELRRMKQEDARMKAIVIFSSALVMVVILYFVSHVLGV